MAIVDYRLNPFLNVLDTKKIIDEKHIIPMQSPYIVRLNEVPEKTAPTGMVVKFENGKQLTEVAALPSVYQYWPDYNTSVPGVENWNTGTLLFNSGDAGKEIIVSYNGMGSLVDDRLQDMLELKVNGSVQGERDAYIRNGSVQGNDGTAYESESDGGRRRNESFIRIRQHPAISAGTYTLREVIEKLVNTSQTLEFISGSRHINCDCSDDS